MRDRHRLSVASLLLLSGALAVTSLVGDSATFDETDHLVSGFSYLAKGDFRLAPDHPPLVRLWAALPLRLLGVAWPDPAPGWLQGDYWQLGREWLFRQNRPDALLIPARLMIVALLLALELLIYAAARTLAGREAGLLALTLAALDTTLLAHGRLVTTDLASALFLLCAVLTWARLLDRTTSLRWLSAAGATAGLVLSKMSWPLALPALFLTAVFHVLSHAPATRARSRGALRAAGLALSMVLAGYVAIWLCYGLRYAMFARDEPRATTLLVPLGAGERPPGSLEEAWEIVLGRGDAEAGWVSRGVQFAREHRILPEAYLFGIAFTEKANRARTSYFAGRYSNTGFPEYFPFLLTAKTPLATSLLILAGLVRLRRSSASQQPALLLGLLALACVALAAAIFGGIHIGHRHVLPVYPPLLAVAGAAAGWAPHGRFWRHPVLALLVAWLFAANLWIHPHYLSYFNELVGGPARAHRFVVDSNLDWGQDLKRLAQTQRRDRIEPLYLAYFGSADPAGYGLRARSIAGWPFGGSSELGPGTYAVSVTTLAGVFEPHVREEFWREPANAAAYRQLLEAAPDPASGQARGLERLRAGLLLSRLRSRPFDGRVGWSIFLYRLDASEIARLTAPP